ncbi:MAG: hypothetical protein NZ853_11225 [Leptospiraceae bacterium]|nr:hypothetical protein [Leptospiraceae bacterium]MDW7975472.1 hypothetical protein [Leptospiraceae bacterium]
MTLLKKRILFNLIKHHIQLTKKIFRHYAIKRVPLERILSLTQRVGTNQFDVYTGSLNISQIIEDLKWENVLYHHPYLLLFRCRDHSVWLSQGIWKNQKLYHHIFPARKNIAEALSENGYLEPLRIHSNKYKTLLIAYWLYLNQSEHNDYLYYIERAREILGLSKINHQHSKVMDDFIRYFI